MKALLLQVDKCVGTWDVGHTTNKRQPKKISSLKKTTKLQKGKRGKPHFLLALPFPLWLFLLFTHKPPNTVGPAEEFKAPVPVFSSWLRGFPYPEQASRHGHPPRLGTPGAALISDRADRSYLLFPEALAFPSYLCQPTWAHQAMPSYILTGIALAWLHFWLGLYCTIMS